MIAMSDDFRLQISLPELHALTDMHFAAGAHQRFPGRRIDLTRQ